MEPHFELASIYGSRYDYELSLQLFEKCILNNYNQEDSILIMSRILYHQQKYEESMELISKL
jgi:hypothetical protein